MSHVVSIAPPGPFVLSPGESFEFDVEVSDVAGDDHGKLRFVGSDGITVLVDVTIDRKALEGIIAGSAEPHQVAGESFEGDGTLEVVGLVGPGLVRFRFTAPE